MQGDNVDSIGVNTPVMILGSLQAYKNFITGKVLVYVLAETAQQITGEHWDYENEVQLSGALGSGITYRETPLGKRISDISVLVENRLKTKAAALPKRADRGGRVYIHSRNTSREASYRLLKYKHIRRARNADRPILILYARKLYIYA